MKTTKFPYNTHKKTICNTHSDSNKVRASTAAADILCEVYVVHKRPCYGGGFVY